MLEAFDRLTVMSFGDVPFQVDTSQESIAPLPDLSWAHPAQPQTWIPGAALAAILKAIEGPRAIRDIRLASALMLEPRLLVPLLTDEQASEWRRLSGQRPTADGNVTAFATRINAAWGAAVLEHRGNARLDEDLANGTWAPGSGLDAIYTSGGRTVAPASCLRHSATWMSETAMTSLPDEISDWISNAAAA